MLWAPRKGKLLEEHNTGAVGSLNIGTAVTTGAAAGTKGSVAQLIAATSFDSYLIHIMACDYGLSATACEGMLDILIGAPTEEILIPNLLMGHCAGPNLAAIPASMGKQWLFPLYIPAGSEISAQAAGARVSTAFRVAVHLYGGNAIPLFEVGTRVDTYPSAPSVPRGTPITPGASGAEGSWTEVVASPSKSYFAVVPSFQVETDTGVSQRAYALDIGIGTATEEEIAESYWFVTGTGEGMTGPWPPQPLFLDQFLTRIVARVSNSGTNDAAYGVAVHCVY